MASTERRDHAQSDTHDHDHDHDHTHDHVAGDHHGHAHDPAAVVAPGVSLVRLSALQRLAGATFLSALIWTAVRWAMS